MEIVKSIAAQLAVAIIIWAYGWARAHWKSKQSKPNSMNTPGTKLLASKRAAWWLCMIEFSVCAAIVILIEVYFRGDAPVTRIQARYLFLAAIAVFGIGSMGAADYSAYRWRALRERPG